MKLVFVTQELDPVHPALGQTLDLVTALAARVDTLAVVTRRNEWDALPPNATADSFDARTRAGRVIAFERAIFRATRDADAVLVHMVPQFALLAWPAARARRAPLLLWYTHWHASRSLRLAAQVADRVVSVDTSSFPLTSAKVDAIGHAIDVERFAARPPRSPDGTLRLLALGRTARWKGLLTLIEALPEAGVELTICGPSLSDDELAHRAELERVAAGDTRITISDPTPRDRVPELIGAHDVLVSPNEPATGATLDKAVFEAAACERLAVSTNPAFSLLLDELPLRLLAPPRDPDALREVLSGLVAAAPGARAAVAAELRERVVTGHSLTHWADAVVATIRSLRG